MIYWLLIVFLFKFSTQQNQDASFVEFCTASGGTFIKHTGYTVDTIGDRCTGSFGNELIVNNQEEADNFCIKFGPYHFLKAHLDSDNMVTCDYEAIHICRVGYKQIRGRCYRIANSRRSDVFSKAESICKAEGIDDNVYVHYSDEIGYFIRGYFTDLSAIWTNVPDATLLDVHHADNGKNHAVLYGTAGIYGAGAVSLAKIPDDHVAMIMCEYIPDETFRSLHAKLVKLAPYMYPMVLDNTFWLWRTFNHYSPESNIHGTRFADHQNKCKKSLSALMPTKHVKMFNPTIKAMEAVGDTLKDHTIYLAPFRHCQTRWCSAAFKWDGEIGSCWETASRNVFNAEYKQCSANCDHNRNAVMMLYEPGGNYEFYFTPRRPAPILCDVDWDGYKKVNAPCPAEWITVERADGTRACHLHVTTQLQRDEARDHCQKNYGALLAGWRSVEELRIIQKFGDGWVSLKRNKECPRAQETDPTDKCHYDNIFEDPDEMSDNSLEGRRIHRTGLCPNQPENAYKFEYCMTFAAGGCMHDYNCDFLFPFTCTKIAEKVEQ